MIFGSVINDNLKDEIIVTVIATGFIEDEPPISETFSQPTLEEWSNPIQKERRRQHNPKLEEAPVQEFLNAKQTNWRALLIYQRFFADEIEEAKDVLPFYFLIPYDRRKKDNLWLSAHCFTKLQG